jgi:dihydrofolate reductase
MTEFVLYSATSIDGRIADGDGGVGWLDPFSGEDHGYAEFIATIDALVMGRKTFDQVLGFGEWPYAGKPTLVLTHREPPPGAPLDTEFAALDPRGVEQWASERGFRRVWLVGGAEVCGAFLRAGLVHQMQLFLMPVVLGAGPALIEGGGAPAGFRLESCEAKASGVVALGYTAAP